jgi:uncharacterized membrane protein
MLKKVLFILISCLVFSFAFASSTFAQMPGDLNFKESYTQGKIISILSQKTQTTDGMTSLEQKFKVQLLDGKEKGKTVVIEMLGDSKTSQKLNQGDTVVVDSKQYLKGGTEYSIYEPYRLNYLFLVLIAFILLIGFVGGKKGIGAIIGLAVSLAIISLWIIPQILHGQDPLQTCLVGAFAILVFTTYIAHGISLKTTVAIIGTTLAFLFAAWLATTLVGLMQATGLGSEDVYNLQIGSNSPINPQGLLLGGILIATLGALNDITTTQSMTIFTLVKENPKQKLSELFGKGMDIGKEHIASLINTLILAFAGSSLAVLIFFELNPLHLPVWVILNNESTMEEIIKSIVGSSALILAVPITSLIAAWVASRGTTIKDFLDSIL